INLVLQDKDPNSIVVREFMHAPLPALGLDATLEDITWFIPGKYPAVLVDVGGGRYDIITKFDLVRAVGALAEGKR
ncbi:MAG: cystathionine beta-synthase, partial [Gammaproteobacteria bacterium]